MFNIVRPTLVVAFIALLPIFASAQTADSDPQPLQPLTFSDLDYPLESLIGSERGIVGLDISIDSDGRVVSGVILSSSGSQSLDQRALSVAKTRWKFKPGTRNGAATSSSLQVQAPWSLMLTPAADIPTLGDLPKSAPGTVLPVALTEHVLTVDNYPKAQLANFKEGSVIIKYLVGKDGTVLEVKIVDTSGTLALDDAAISIVKTWQFQPGRIDGQDSEMWQAVNFQFKIPGIVLVPQKDSCHPQPLLGETIDTGTHSGIPYVRWLQVNEQNQLVDDVLDTKQGWVHLSKKLIEQAAANFSRLHQPVRADIGAKDCWILSKNDFLVVGRGITVLPAGLPPIAVARPPKPPCPSCSASRP